MEIFNNEFVTLYNCDSRQIPIPDESVDCVVTSPPYYGLRDYGINGQIGLEESPEEYANTMVEVFREVWRVLKPTGTVWLNLGDSYSSQGGAEPEQTVRKSSNYVNRGQLGKDGVGLDPFVGSGTTAAVAQKYGRKSVGVDLNKEYLDIAVRRITSTQPVLL